MKSVQPKNTENRFMTSMTLAELWIAHSQTRFPKGYGGKSINGVCVSYLDVNLDGCISTYMAREANSLDLNRYLVLQKAKLDLEDILPDLNDEAFIYFQRLHTLCCLVLKEATIE